MSPSPGKGKGNTQRKRAGGTLSPRSSAGGFTAEEADGAIGSRQALVDGYDEDTYDYSGSAIGSDPDDEGTLGMATKSAPGSTRGGRRRRGGPAGPQADADSPPGARSYTQDYSGQSLWTAEYGHKKGTSIQLRDGSEVKASERIEDPAYKPTHGLSAKYVTVGYYSSRGLDGLDYSQIEHIPGSSLVVVHEPNGETVAYNYRTGDLADEKGTSQITRRQMAAAMAGDYERCKQDGGQLANQYVHAYNDYAADPSQPNLIKACASHYAWRKEQKSEKLHVGSDAMSETARDYANNASGGGTTSGAPGTTGTSTPTPPAGSSSASNATSAASSTAAPEKEGAEKTAEATKASADKRRGTGRGRKKQDADDKRGLTADHKKLKEAAGLEDFDASGLEEADKGYIPTPDQNFVLSQAASEVAEDAGFSRSIGHRSYQVMGDPGAGKNFLLRQMSAAEGRPHLEVDCNESMDVNEFFGANSMQDGSMTFQKGKITEAAEKGYRIVINEPNTAPPEMMTIFHNVVGSGSDPESRFITITSPESSDTEIKVNRETDFVFTFNPEGTARETRLPRALGSRMPNFKMALPTDADGGRMVSAQASRMLAERGEGPVSPQEGERDWVFVRQLRESVADGNSRGYERAPDSRFAHTFAAHRHSRGLKKALRLTEDFIDQDSDSAEDAAWAWSAIQEIAQRNYGSAGGGGSRRSR